MEMINTLPNLGIQEFNFSSLFIVLLSLYLSVKFFLSVLAFVFTENVAGKVVVVTGASSGIGEQMAYEYARRGSCLVLAARREKSLRQVSGKCRELGSPDTLIVTADVSNVEDCKRIVDSSISHFGRLDHLVNNAGIASSNIFEEYEDITTARTVMDINFWGSIYVTRFAIPHLRKTKGKILVVSSSASWVAMPRQSFYNASKAATVALYETLRIELRSDIHITIATPGFVESEMTKGKHFTSDGQVEVNPDLRDVTISVFPVGKADACAKSLVNAVCRGQKYVTNPTFFTVTYWFKVFFPDLMEWFMRVFYVNKRGEAPTKSLSKKIIDLPGLKAILHPSTLYSPEFKTE